MEAADAGVALGAESNKISRTAPSKFGVVISAAGGGDGCGQLGGGRTRFPMLPQPQSASAKISHHGIVLSLGMGQFLVEDFTDADERLVLLAFLPARLGFEIGALFSDVGAQGSHFGACRIALGRRVMPAERKAPADDQHRQQ